MANYQGLPKDQIMLQDAKKEIGEEAYNVLLQSERDENKFINSLKSFVANNARDISTSQLRNIFSKVKNIKNYQMLYLLRPKLAYVYGRTDNRNKGMKKLLSLLDDQIQKVDNKEKLEQFQNFFESVIAYHKFYEGGN